MALNANNLPKDSSNSGVSQEPLPAGNYPARIVQIIDLGLQPQRPYQGQEKAPAPEINITYELVDEFMKDEDGKDVEDKPRWVFEDIPFNPLYKEKAKSTLRYNVFDPDQTKYNGDFTKLIGLPCMVAVIQNPSKGKIYNNVANVAAMRPRDAANCPELKNPSKVFDCESPDLEVFKKLSKYVQEKIRSNLTFKGSILEKKLTGNNEKIVEVKEDNSQSKDAVDNNPY